MATLPVGLTFVRLRFTVGEMRMNRRELLNVSIAASGLILVGEGSAVAQDKTVITKIKSSTPESIKSKILRPEGNRARSLMASDLIFIPANNFVRVETRILCEQKVDRTATVNQIDGSAVKPVQTYSLEYHDRGQTGMGARPTWYKLARNSWIELIYTIAATDVKDFDVVNLPGPPPVTKTVWRDWRGSAECKFEVIYSLDKAAVENAPPMP